MSLAQTCGIYPLAAHHLDTLQHIASDPVIAATTRLPHPYPPDGARTFFARLQVQRQERTAEVFAIEDRKRLVGVCGLHDIGVRTAEVGFFVAREHHGKGYATFGVGMLLPFAFDNLRLDEIFADALATNAASRRVLAKLGFAVTGEHTHQSDRWPRDVPLVRHVMTPALWRQHRDGPALQALCAPLRAILDAELAAGNEVRETGRDFPEPGSVLIRLRHPFRALPSPLPPGVVHTAVNDPHWWMAELSFGKPRHLLIH